MTAQELNELLKQADRSKAWLARHIGVAERTVQRYADGSSPIPEVRAERIRGLLARESALEAAIDETLHRAMMATMQLSPIQQWTLANVIEPLALVCGSPRDVSS